MVPSDEMCIALGQSPAGEIVSISQPVDQSRLHKLLLTLLGALTFLLLHYRYNRGVFNTSDTSFSATE
jgi:hypothetical protein